MDSSSASAPARQSHSFTIPQCLALGAAALLAAASTTANVSAALAKHDTLASQFVAGSLAVAVAALVLVSLPAAMMAFRERRLIASGLALVMFALAGAYSTSSALGILAKPRLESGMNADHIAKDRARIADERSRHWAELTMLAPSKSTHELSPEIARILALPGLGGCALINGPVTRQWCPTLSGLQAEHARAERRSALEGTITRLDTEVARLGTPKLANADAAALVAVLAAFGIAMDANVVNVALMLLAVTILECGSGLSLAIAQSLRVAMPVAMRDITPAAVSASLDAVAQVPALVAPAIVEAPVTASATVTAAAERIAELVRNAGGTLHVQSKREVARLINASAPTTNRALVALAGVVSVAASADGIAVKMVA